MSKFHIVVDLAKCVGCHSCIMACKDEHCGNCWLPYTDEQRREDEKWIRIKRVERGNYPHAQVHYLPSICNHCDNAACIKAFPDVFYKREDGIVMIDAVKAKGRPEIKDACPFGAIDWNEDLQVAQKCTGCAHLLDSDWKEPRCVQVCPLRALRIVKCEDGDFEKLAMVKGLEPLHGSAAKPRVVYKNLHLYKSVFVCGAVETTGKDGLKTCAKGVQVDLCKGNEVVASTVTDMFGDFYFDKLEKNSGEYIVKIGGQSFKATVGAECADIGLVTI